MVQIISFSVLIAGMILAILSDIKHHKIPNALSVTLLVSGMAINIFEMGGLVRSVIGALVGLLLGVSLWLLSIVKAGDAKLMAAIGALVGWRWLLNALCWSILVGMIIGIAVLLRKRQLSSRMKRVWEYIKFQVLMRKFTPYEPQKGTEGELPFTVPLAIGCILAEFVTLF